MRLADSDLIGRPPDQNKIIDMGESKMDDFPHFPPFLVLSFLASPC